MTTPITKLPTHCNIPDGFFDAVADRFGTRLSRAAAVREHHGRDESPYPPMLPDAVVFAASTEEVAWLVSHCNQHLVPVIAFGAGSSLEGHLLAAHGGVCVDLSQMDQMVAVNTEDSTVTVQAGVTRKRLNDELRHTGLFFPIDPGADASLGGMAATRASGTNAVRYGTMRENVVNLTVVTADGQVIKTASRARKSSAGYDLTHLYVGSEGTLGIITEVTVRLYPRPEATTVAICSFSTLHDAVRSVIDITQMAVPVARVEFLDPAAVRAVNAYSKLTLQESPLLLFEFHGSPSAVKEQAKLVQDITAEHQCQDFHWAEQPEERSRLWKARHEAYFAALQLRPGCIANTTDVCVPISRLADCIVETASELEQASFPYIIAGHVGDGNFHVSMLVDPDSSAEWQESETINRNLVNRAIAMDGTCTGEHGVGLHKREFMLTEHGAAAIAIMRSLKQTLDPNNILNPGKIFPENSS